MSAEPSLFTLVAAGGVALSTLLAVVLRPWRLMGPAGPPWPLLVLWAALPALWSPERWSGAEGVLPVSGAALLVLTAGWPLSILAFLPVAVAMAALGPLDAAEVLQRMFLLGTLPATLALAGGALVRRLSVHALPAYLLGRAFGATLATAWITGLLDVALHRSPLDAWGDAIVGALMVGLAEAMVTMLVVTVLLVVHPAWVATFSERAYSPGHAAGRPRPG